MARRRQSNPNNQALSDLINRRLQELGKNQSWLAGRIGLSRQTVSMYGRGKVLPKNDKTLRRICTALGLERTLIAKIGLSRLREQWQNDSG